MDASAMEANKLQFPLTRLPINAARNVLRIVDNPQLIGFSLLSKKSKNLVESLDIFVRSIHIVVGNTIVINFHGNGDVDSFCCTFFAEHGEAVMYQGPIYKPPSILFGRNLEANENKWENENFEMKNWMEHFKVIFHQPKIFSLTVSIGRFHLESVLEHFKDFKSLSLIASPDINQSGDIKKYVHTTSQLDLDGRLFPNQNVPPSILMQNFDRLDITEGPIVGLNDLLICGSKYIEISGLQFTGKEINRFIKLWKKGSNPRLECIHHDFDTNDDSITTEVLKNLNSQIMKPEERRVFKPTSIEHEYVEDGWDIFREDGMKATIVMFTLHSFFRFSLYVWHPHCIVTNYIDVEV